MKLKKLLLTAILLLSVISLNGCSWFEKDTLVLTDSEVVYIIEGGKLNFYDNNGKLIKTAELKDLEGWYALSPGFLKKLIDAKIDKDNPEPAHPDE